MGLEALYHISANCKKWQQPFKDQIEYHKGGVEFRERRKAGEFKGDPEKEAAEQEKLEVLRKKAG